MTNDSNRLTCAILATSDIHGYMYPTDYRSEQQQPFGLAKLAALIGEERARYAAALLIDNGDMLQGSPLASHYAKYNRHLTHPGVAACNHLRYDAAIIGNHEFNYGPELLRKAVADSRFPWLAANVIDRRTGEPAFGQPYLIKLLHGQVKTAVLGLTTSYIPNWEKPEHIGEFRFDDTVRSAKKWVTYIRENERPDLMIVAYHGGLERDPVSGRETEKLTGENQGYALCSEVEGIDVLITGHQHRMLADKINGVSVVQPGCNGQALGEVAIELERTKEGRWTVADKTERLIPVQTDTGADPEIIQLLHREEADTQAWLNEPIGTVDGDMTVNDPMSVRLEDHPFVELMNRVQLEISGAEISAAALLSNQSRGFGPTVTMRDVLTNFMYPNTLKVLRLTGQDIKDALEQSARYFALDEQGRIAVSREYTEPKPQHYNYDMWEGIEYEIRVSAPIGQRIVKLTRRGQELDLSGEYDVVMSSYRAAGGGDFDMYRGKPVVKEIELDYAEMMADYISQRGVIHADCNGNWRVLP